MPYAPEQKKNSRERVLEAALKLFKERGFEQVSIDEVMAEAGLTRGGFYAHFTSKADLIAQAILEVAGRPDPIVAELGTFADFADTYISARHRDNPAGGCAGAALTQSIAREGPEARAAYTEFLKSFAGVIDQHLGNEAHALSDDALALLAQMIGTVQMARAVSDPMLSTRILKAGRQAVDYLLPPEEEAPISQ